MIKILKRIIIRLINIFGYTIARTSNPDSIVDREFNDIYKKCREYTMTTRERMHALYKATQYIVKAKIPGDFVECGVWRGGSAMIIAYTLIAMGETNRKIYLYDTFEGMPEPTVNDYAVTDKNFRAVPIWKKHQKNKYNQWCYSPLHEVMEKMVSTGYPKEGLVFVKGKVEDTIPNTMPPKIALLRLDTDLYESTRHELANLFTALALHGVLLLDDYGTWAGAKKAVDEYFATIPILLNQIDSDGRICIKI